MRSREKVRGWFPCRVGGPSSKRIRVVIALVAAMFCVGWLSSVAVATVICDEESSYCRDVNLRCTYSGSGQNCCIYTCAPDETCTATEQQPLLECAPPDVDVRFNVYSGAPGCGTLDGQITVINQSDFYWYKFDASMTGDSSQIWSCEACHEEINVEDQQVAPKGQSNDRRTYSVTFDTEPEGCSCPTAYVPSGCCDNCQYDYREEIECNHKHCSSSPTATQTEAVCTSITEYDVTVVAWSEDGTSWRPFDDPVTVPVYRFTSACSQ